MDIKITLINILRKKECIIFNIIFLFKIIQNLEELYLDENGIKTLCSSLFKRRKEMIGNKDPNIMVKIL